MKAAMDSHSLFFRISRRLAWKLFTVLPVDRRKIVVQSFYGRGFSDNPKAIVQEILRKGLDYRIFWNVSDVNVAHRLPQEVTPIQIDSLKSIYHMCTAGIWIDNSRKWSFVNKKPSQVYIQTWHGFALKRIEKDVADSLGEAYVKSAMKDSRMCDLILSNSSFLTDIYRKSFWYDGEILSCGFPRNDILFHRDEEILEGIRKRLNLPSGRRILLYAPTFRKGFGLEVYDIDYERCVRTLEARFGGEWSILIKFHPNIAKKAERMDWNSETLYDASSYPDIQELFLVADALITDYSSVMFDYMLLGKPGFLYVNDIENYRNDRNFYLDIDSLPFERAEDNDELEDIIRHFNDDEYQDRLEKFKTEFDLREQGTASSSVVQWMEKRVNSQDGGKL